MNLLFLTPQLPYPPQQGTTLRNFNLIRHLARNHSITLVAFGTRAELEAAQPLRALCQRIEIVQAPTRSLAQRMGAMFFSAQPDMALRLAAPEMHALIRNASRAHEFGWMQIEGIEMARYGRQVGNHRILFDDHNAEYVLQRTAFESDVRRPRRWHAALYSLIQWRKLARYEREVCLATRAVVAVSEADAKALRALDARIQPIVIPNGVDVEYFKPNDGEMIQPGLVFTGKMDYRPNIDAMIWFCDEIMPRLWKEIPDAQLTIVGQKPTKKIYGLGTNKRIHVTGRVDDTRPFISAASIYIAPLRMGSGTRLKILEAMAMGKAIVSTTRGAEGIECVAERDLLIADSPNEFAEKISALIHDAAKRKTLGENARRLVEAKYDWGKLVSRFEEIYQ